MRTVLAPSDRSGARLTLLPDRAIFTRSGLDASTLLEPFTELAFLLPGLTIQFADRRVHVLRQPRGLAGHLEAEAGESRINRPRAD